jgi:hypothetical protein
MLVAVQNSRIKFWFIAQTRFPARNAVTSQLTLRSCAFVVFVEQIFHYDRGQTEAFADGEKKIASLRTCAWNC